MTENTFVPEFLIYNNFGIRPVEATFQLDCKTFTETVRKIASEKISGIEEVTLQNDKNGNVALFIWFNANSEHFSDSSTENTAIKAKLSRLSKDMQEFIERFGWNEADDDPHNGSTKIHSNKIIINNDNPEVKGKWIAIHVAINPFLLIMFDMQGSAYKKQFNRNSPKTRIRREWVWSKGSSGKFHSLNGIRITKMIFNPTISRDGLHAKMPGKF